jgi:glycosyltransferase involved in cell wall biosynthesis
MKLSVLVPTYNQQEYIAQCLESVVTQKTDFDYEILIGDDASIDGTSEICKKYCPL